MGRGSPSMSPGFGEHRGDLGLGVLRAQPGEALVGLSRVAGRDPLRCLGGKLAVAAE